jgi:cold shock CspA family protein
MSMGEGRVGSSHLSAAASSIARAAYRSPADSVHRNRSVFGSAPSQTTAVHGRHDDGGQYAPPGREPKPREQRTSDGRCPGVTLSSAEDLHGQLRFGSRKRPLRVPPVERRALPATGRILAVTVGQGTGFIVGAGGKVFFHRSDVQAPTSINDLELGDAVEFDLVDDTVSGPRAVRVRRLSALSRQSL